MNTPFDQEPHRQPGLLSGLRTSFLTGIVVITPVWLTIWLIWSVVGWFDNAVLPLIPQRFQPSEYAGINLPGAGIIIYLIFTVLVGWIAKGIIGRSLIHFAEGLIDQMPVVRSVYSGVKQISETVFAQTDQSFEKACLVQYPRRGIWAVGFVSTATRGEIRERADTGNEMLSVFVPTTPNPTSGFLLFFPAEDVILLDMSIEDAAKLVISAGLVYPDSRKPVESEEKMIDHVT